MCSSSVSSEFSPAQPRRIYVVRLTDAPPVAPDACPACGWPLRVFGCRLETTWNVRPGAGRIRVVHDVQCPGPLDAAALIPVPVGAPADAEAQAFRAAALRAIEAAR